MCTDHGAYGSHRKLSRELNLHRELWNKECLLWAYKISKSKDTKFYILCQRTSDVEASMELSKTFGWTTTYIITFLAPFQLSADRWSKVATEFWSIYGHRVLVRPAVRLKDDIVKVAECKGERLWSSWRSYRKPIPNSGPTGLRMILKCNKP